MDSTDDRRVMDAKTQAMLNALMEQRNQAANALVEQLGLNAQLQAEWMSRWSDVGAIKDRLRELEAQITPP